MTKRILYIVPHRKNRSPGQRFRCEHFIPYVETHDYKITYANLLSAWDDSHFYRKNNYLVKTFILIKTFVQRFFQLQKVKKYDAVLIYREAFMLGTTYFERLIARKKVPIIFDFDDAIWLNDVSDANAKLKWLKRPGKTADICQLANLVIAGNQYLANYATQHNNNVKIVPTTLDTDYHKSRSETKADNLVRIGWTGSSTTLKHFRLLIPVLIKLQQKYKKRLAIRVIADEPVVHKQLHIENVQWSPSDEIQRLDEVDIGIMPLPDDQWSKGKCGFKGLQYMSMGIPAVMSPVGVNKEIIDDGHNGFLAANNKAWEDKLTRLIESAELRKKIGQAGRNTVLESYSNNAWKDQYLEYFDEVIASKNLK